MNPERFAFGIMVVTSLLAVLATATAIRSMEGSKRPAAAAASAVLFSVALLMFLWVLGYSVS